MATSSGDNQLSVKFSEKELNKYLLIFLIAIYSVGCVKLEVKPGRVVADTVDAGKNLFSTIKGKRNGEEEREYKHSLLSSGEEQDTKNIGKCKQQIKENIESSSLSLSKVISESSDVSVVDGNRKITCNMVVLVKAQ